MREQLEQLRQQALSAITAAGNDEALQEVRVRFLGR